MKSLHKNLLLLTVICLLNSSNGEEEIKITRELVEDLEPDLLQCLFNRGYELKVSLLQEANVTDTNVEKIRNLNIIDKYALKLYEWFTERKRGKPLVAMALVNKVICFPKGCIDIANPGFHP